MVEKQRKQKLIISLFHVRQKLPGRNVLFLCIMKIVSVFFKKKKKNFNTTHILANKL